MMKWIAILLSVCLTVTPVFAETQKQMLYRLQDELNALRADFEWLVEEMTIKFTRLREFNQRTLEELNRHLQVISKQFNDQDERIRTLEPKVQALENAVSEVVVSSIGDPLPKGDPPPKIGEAVHFDATTGLIYRANLFNRTNVIGVLTSNGVVARDGETVKGFGGTPSTTYYLSQGAITTVASFLTATDKTVDIRYDASNYAQSESVVLTAGTAITDVFLSMLKTGLPTYNFYIEIRSDNAGVPSSTILATSEYLPASYLPAAWVDDSSTGNRVRIRFMTPYVIPTTGTYHFCVQADTVDVNTSNYISVRAVDAGGYANGQRCYSDSSGSWTADSTDDLNFVIYGFDTTSTTGSLSSSTHPLTYDNWYHVPYVIEIGKTDIQGNLVVGIKRHPIYTFLVDYTTEVSNTGTTEKYYKYADLTTYSVSRINVSYRIKVDTAGRTATVTPKWNYFSGVAAGTPAVNMLCQNNLNETSFTNNPIGHNSVGFSLDNAHASGVTTVGMVVIKGSP